MKKIKIKGLNEEYFFTKLKNGLEVYLMPDNKSKKFQISCLVKYGSVYNDFRVGSAKEYIHLPNGVAHFLEHLMFKEADGKDANEKFAKYGSFSNAYTSLEETKYYVIGAKNFKDNLNLLLDFIYNPYFTKENVSKERDVIIREINSGNDNPYKVLNTKAIENIYYYNRFKDSVIGSINEVKDITLENINTAYKAFYNPHNMVVVITGKFNKEEAIRTIKSNKLLNQNYKIKKVSLKKIKEPLNVKKSYEELFKNIEIPKTAIRIKLPYKEFKSIKVNKIKLCLSLMLEAKLGSTSKLNEALVNKGLIIGSLYFSTSIDNDNILLSIFFESKTPQKVIKILKTELKVITITKEELERKKRCIISNLVLAYDDMRNKNEFICNSVISYGKFLYNQYNVVKNLTVTDINKVIKKIFIDKNNIAVMVIKPIKKSAK